ncbi:MAG: lysophospholipid acyltransferase family protein [Arenibacterium sp.]
MSLRKKIADSRGFNRAVEGLLAGYVRFAQATSRWDMSGFEAMNAELAKGEPVIFTVWHQRLVMAPFMFDQSLGKFCSLTSGARAGRLVGQVLARFGFDTIPMASRKRHIALSREVLRKMSEGYTIGIACDGPRGPARQASTVPLVWARSTGKRIFVLSWSANRVLKFPSWDRFILPLPFSRGTLVCHSFDRDVPRKMDEAQTEQLRSQLEAALDAVTAESDNACGRDPVAMR